MIRVDRDASNNCCEVWKVEFGVYGEIASGKSMLE